MQVDKFKTYWLLKTTIWFQGLCIVIYVYYFNDFEEPEWFN